jgi:hypothetical protein
VALDDFITRGVQKNIDSMVVRLNVHGIFAFAFA